MDANAAFDAIQKIARSSKNLADLESMKARARAVIDQFKHRTRGLPLSRKSGSSASTSTEHARPGGSTRWRPRFSWRRVIVWPAPAGFTAQRPAAPRRPHRTASSSPSAARTRGHSPLRQRLTAPTRFHRHVGWSLATAEIISATVL
jgi:hypothetical protein